MPRYRQELQFVWCSTGNKIFHIFATLMFLQVVRYVKCMCRNCARTRNRTLCRHYLTCFTPYLIRSIDGGKSLSRFQTRKSVSVRWREVDRPTFRLFFPRVWIHRSVCIPPTAVSGNKFLSVFGSRNTIDFAVDEDLSPSSPVHSLPRITPSFLEFQSRSECHCQFFSRFDPRVSVRGMLLGDRNARTSLFPPPP